MCLSGQVSTILRTPLFAANDCRGSAYCAGQHHQQSVHQHSTHEIYCDCRHEYGEAELTLELVSSMDEAIDHLHAHGSGHTECIITGESLHLHPETQ
jgi:gamma-glutamyl phosphate reductase